MQTAGVPLEPVDSFAPLLAALEGWTWEAGPDGREEGEGRPPWADRIHPADVAAVQAARQRARAGGPVVHDFRLVLPDGEVRQVEESVAVTPRGGLRGVVLDVSRWRRMESSLRVYRRIFEASKDGIAVIDTAGRYMQQNPAHRKLIGYSDPELEGATPAIHLGQEAFARIGEELAARGEWRGEVESRNRAGRVRTVDLSAFTVHDEQGGVLCHVGIKRDVTDRKDRENELRFNARLLDLVGESVVATDLAGRITYWNRRAEETFGWAREEVLGRGLVAVLATPASREQAQILVDRVLRGEAWSGELQVARRDGTTFPALVSDAPVRDEGGRLIGLVGVLADLSVRAGIEAGLRLRLRELAAIYRLVDAVARAQSEEDIQRAALDAVESALGTSRAAILVADAAGVPRFRAWRNLSDGYRAAVEGHSPWPADARDPAPIVVPDAEAAPSLAPFLPVLRAEGIRALAFVPLTWEGRLLGKFMIYHGQPRELREDELQLARTIAHHVAFGLARQRDAAELEAARRQVAATGRLATLGSLVSGVAHEVRTPLTFISTNVQIARRRMPSAPPEVLSHLDAALEGVDRINRLVTDLRPFARLRGGRVRSGVHEVVAGAVHLFRTTHAPLPPLEIDLAPTPPVELDREQIQQVVLNLLDNAADAAPKGRIAVRVRPGGAGAQIVVEDDGEGIPSELHDRIFDPFFTTKPEGTGLGLSIVRRIVDGHGGTVAVESALGKGSRFVVSLPAAGEIVSDVR